MQDRGGLVPGPGEPPVHRARGTPFEGGVTAEAGGNAGPSVTMEAAAPHSFACSLKHLPKLQTADGERRNRYLYVAIDRRSRSVHLAVKDNETEQSAIAFLREAAAAFPFRLTHVLTDNGSCFTPAFAKVCAALGAAYRPTRPYTPQINGMVERFHGRVGSEVLGITLSSHRDLEPLLRGFNAAYNARRQRVLKGKTPDQIVAERLKARRKLANAKPHGRAGPNDIAKARLIAEAAKGVS